MLCKHANDDDEGANSVHFAERGGSDVIEGSSCHGNMAACSSRDAGTRREQVCRFSLEIEGFRVAVVLKPGSIT